MAISVNGASYAFGTMETGTGQILQAPRSKFNFRVDITLNGNTKPLSFERIKSATIPDITYDTQIVNQYNVKRVIQTKMNYGSTTIVFYDTYDNHFANKIAKPYTKNYYNSNNGFASLSDPIGAQVNTVIGDTFTTRMGLSLTTTENRYHIPLLELIKLGPKDVTEVYKLYNCMITQLSGDTMDYSSSEPIVFSVTFQPERIEIISDYSGISSHASQAGF